MSLNVALFDGIGIKHDFPFINICKVPREVLKTSGFSQDPEGGIENQGRSPRFSASPEGPCEC